MWYLRSTELFVCWCLLGSGSRLRPRSRFGRHGEVWLGVGTVGKELRLVHWVGGLDHRETGPHGQKRSRELVMHTMPCSGVSQCEKQMEMDGGTVGGRDGDIAARLTKKKASKWRREPVTPGVTDGGWMARRTYVKLEPLFLWMRLIFVP
ncbi:hypothetical protein LY76DRAFT_586616 [Colletotrichum caudatum]|nr:hypothetical protein LY76DRAFT_586616 [Colletotrichum caudatum]